MLKWLSISALVVVVDQLTKFVVGRNFALYESLEVTPFFNLVLVHNRGAAFSFLSSAGGWQRPFFITIALVAAAWISWLLRKHPNETLFCFALSLILGGAVGNVIDRLIHGQVVDFLLFHQGNWYFPAFNVADSAITVGAVLLILDELLRMKRVRATT